MPTGSPLASASARTRLSALRGCSEPVGSCRSTRTAPSSGSAFARSISVSTSPVGPGLYTSPASKSRSASRIASAAFRNAEVGLLAEGRTIQATRDGGRTWRVVFRTPRQVTWVGYDPSRRARAVLDDGENLGGPRWQPEPALGELFPPCQTFDNGA